MVFSSKLFVDNLGYDIPITPSQAGADFRIPDTLSRKIAFKGVHSTSNCFVVDEYALTRGMKLGYALITAILLSPRMQQAKEWVPNFEASPGRVAAST